MDAHFILSDLRVFTNKMAPALYTPEIPGHDPVLAGIPKIIPQQTLFHRYRCNAVRSLSAVPPGIYSHCLFAALYGFCSVRLFPLCIASVSRGTVKEKTNHLVFPFHPEHAGTSVSDGVFCLSEFIEISRSVDLFQQWKRKIPMEKGPDLVHSPVSGVYRILPVQAEFQIFLPAVQREHA